MVKGMKKFLTGVAIAATSMIGFVEGANAQSTPNFEKEQYQKALWMTTRFYGAQRSGHGPNWLIADYEPTDVANDCKGNLSAFVKGKSYIKDADGSYDLTGGWYDCGDFATFGQTFFYSAYMLVLSYLEFPEGFDDFYSTDYHGYVESGDYTWEGKKGAPDGIPDVLNEAKYATDFIIKAVRDKNTFYYQKGDGDADHKIWCTSPTKSTLSVSNGGEADGSRYIGKATGNVTSMASLAGAALAGMAQAYAKFDPEYAKLCLEKAKVCYEFVTGTTKGNSGACAFYGNKPKYQTDETIFYAELYRATKDKQYLQAAEKSASWMMAETGYNHNFSLCYNNTEDLGCYLMASLGDDTEYSKYGKTALEFFVKLYKPASGYFLNVKNDGWGVLRFPANQAFVYGLYAKLTGATTVDPYALGSIEYIMGNNGRKFSYIVGFGDSHPFYPHHRNFYRTDNNNEGALPKITKDYKYVQLGYMVGGSLNNGAYTDVEKEYTYSEGGIDYNAGLVGALGYINSMINPVNTNKFGHPSPELGEDLSICGLSSIVLDSKVEAKGNMTFTWFKDGQKLTSSNNATTYEAKEAGEYTCEIDSAGEWQTSGTVRVLAELPEVEWVDEIELCSPSTATLDLSMSVPATYVWSKGDSRLSEKGSSLWVNKAGVYSCEVSAENCEPVVYTTTVTSLLPEVADAESDFMGDVTLKVTGDGEYEWYTTAEGGEPVHSGATFETTISEDSYFYVQDAGEMNVTAGPGESDFNTSSAVNWGNIGAAFTAEKPFSIQEISLYVMGAPYNTGSATLTVELDGDASETFTSDAVAVFSGNKFQKITFSNPIVIPAAGNYTLMVKSGNFAIGYFSNMNNYSSFENQGNPITFTGSTNTNGGFPGYADWKIMTGSGCDRAVVKVKKGLPTSVEDAAAENVVLTPNPCHDYLSVDWAVEGDVNVEILNMLGVVVKATEMDSEALRSGVKVSDLSNGIYILRVRNGNRVINERFVKE
jgi:hypothetical protein